MPLYEYECDNCQKVFEFQQKISDAPLSACPTCGKPVQKLISRTSFQLKGSGWYATDYKKGQSAKPTAAQAPSSSTKTPSEGSKS